MGNMFKFLMVFGLVLGALTLIPLEKAHAEITGIPEKYEDKIDYLIDRGIIQGYPDGSFGGKDEVSRQQAATMIGRALGLDNTKGETPFPDVDKNSYASGYIKSAYEAGVISGYPDGTFKPHKTMTRAGMAFLITQAFDFDEMSGIYFDDVSGPSSRSKAINKLATAGVSIGMPGDLYGPDKNITRTSYSLFVARAINKDFRVEKKLGDEGERVVTGGPLNVRVGPGTNYKALTQFSVGTSVKVHKRVGNWLQVSHGSVLGFIHSNYTSSEMSSSRVIAIDAGHGDGDSGATGNGLLEKEVNLNVSKRVRDYLQNAGIEVVMTRDDDTFVTLAGRVAYAERQKADTFVSIHANAFPDSRAKGVETFYNSASLNPRAYKSYKLSGFIQKHLADAMDTTDRGVKEGNFHVIRDTSLPSALVELGFLTNSSDASKLGSSYWRDRAAKAISRGVIDYYNWEERQ